MRSQHTTNDILASLSPGIVDVLQPETKSFPAHDSLMKPGKPPEWIYLPHSPTIVSMIRSTSEGQTVEVGIVGREGLVSVQSLLSTNAVATEAVVQLPGPVARIRTRRFRDAIAGSTELREAIFRYTAAFLEQVSQNVMCNRLHTIEQRLAKWLLTVRDRIDSDEIALTHEFLSHMLGIRRSGVTVALGALALDGTIEPGRSRVLLLDRDGLEARACECYRTIRMVLDER